MLSGEDEAAFTAEPDKSVSGITSLHSIEGSGRCDERGL